MDLARLLLRIFRLKSALLAVISIALGLVLLELSQIPAVARVTFFPARDLGITLILAGLITVLFKYTDTRDAEQRSERSVITGLGAHPESLRKLSHETRAEHVHNYLTVDFDNVDLAAGVCDLHQQIRTAGEYRYNTHVSITLTPDQPRPGREPMFVATMRWEYELRTPRIDVRRFVSVGDADEYETLLRDPDTTGVWWFPPINNLNASSPDAFALLQHTINGVRQDIIRHHHPGGQTYIAKPDATAVAEPVWHVSYLYRVLVEQHGYQLSLDFDKPTHGLRVDFTADGCGIQYVNVDTKIIGGQKPRITRNPPSTPTPIIIASDGWAYPHSGITLGWTLDTDHPNTGAS